MTWNLIIGKKAIKGYGKMPYHAQQAFARLTGVLREQGPTGPHAWRNYGKLKGRDDQYHCHLTNDHQWIACWHAKEEVLRIEIFYAGSHQKAPY
jgi:hypothetical protein